MKQIHIFFLNPTKYFYYRYGKASLYVPVIFNTGIYNIRMKCRKQADNLHFIRPFSL